MRMLREREKEERPEKINTFKCHHEHTKFGSGNMQI
jgi:hypothetical protein